MTVLSHGTPEEAGFDPERIELLRRRVPEWIDGNRMRSGVLLAARGGTVARKHPWARTHLSGGRDVLLVKTTSTGFISGSLCQWHLLKTPRKAK